MSWRAGLLPSAARVGGAASTKAVDASTITEKGFTMTEIIETTETGQEVAVVTDVQSQIDQLSQPGGGVFSTFEGDDFETRVQVLDAITNPEPISDNLGKTINLVNVVAQRVEVSNTETGGMDQAARVILIDADGTAYAGLSDGLMRSLQNMFAILGKPAQWPGPLPVKVDEAKSRKGFRFFTIKVATAPKK